MTGLSSAPLVWALMLGLGAVVGSFLNVCIYRLPRRESLVLPGSRCSYCTAPIRWHDNIPLLSFLLLGGRCRACKATISWRYPLVEAATVLLFVLVWTRFGLTLEGLRAVLLVSALVVVAFIDLEHRIIPDRVTLPGIVLGLIGAWFLPPGIISSAVGTVVGGGLFYLIALVSRGGMGGGDIKLAAMLGAFLGWQAGLLAIFFGVLAGGVVGVVLLVLRLRGRKDAIPFGPFLAFGGVVALFWAAPILRWYLLQR